MIREKIDSLISDAMKNDMKFELGVLRMVKTELQKYNTSKEAVSKPMDDGVEISILNRMVKQRREAAGIYTGVNPELMLKETREAEYIEGFLPKQASVEEISDEVDRLISSGVEPLKKNMGQIIKMVKSAYPTADGRTVSEIVMKKLS